MRVRDRGDGQRVLVDVEVVVGDVAGLEDQGIVLVAVRDVVLGLRVVVGAGDGEVDRGVIRAVRAVADLVLEAEGLRGGALVRVGRERDRRADQLHGAAERVLDQRDGEDVLEVGVVGEELAGRDDLRRVLGGVQVVVVRDGRRARGERGGGHEQRAGEQQAAHGDAEAAPKLRAGGGSIGHGGLPGQCGLPGGMTSAGDESGARARGRGRECREGGGGAKSRGRDWRVPGRTGGRGSEAPDGSAVRSSAPRRRWIALRAVDGELTRLARVCCAGPARALPPRAGRLHAAPLAASGRAALGLATEPLSPFPALYSCGECEERSPSRSPVGRRRCTLDDTRDSWPCTHQASTGR